jgi:hypothetical protein
MIQASIGPCCAIAGSTISRTFANNFSSDQGATPTKMQQRLVLRRRPRRSRLRCHRLHTLALARQQQAGAIAAQRPAPIRVPDHARKPLHICPKSGFALSAPEIHLSPPR